MKVAQSCMTLCDPIDYTVHGIVQARILEWVAFPVSRGSSHRRDQTQVSHIAGGFFTSLATREAQLEAQPGKATGVGSLSLLQRIFPTQESNWGLLHCKRILYQLSYQGSPKNKKNQLLLTLCLSVTQNCNSLMENANICRTQVGSILKIVFSGLPWWSSG